MHVIVTLKLKFEEHTVRKAYVWSKYYTLLLKTIKSFYVCRYVKNSLPTLILILIKVGKGGYVIYTSLGSPHTFYHL